MTDHQVFNAKPWSEREARSTDKVIDSRGNKDGFIYIYIYSNKEYLCSRMLLSFFPPMFSLKSDKFLFKNLRLTLLELCVYTNILIFLPV